MSLNSLRCGCGSEASCLITGYGWICLECFEKIQSELEDKKIG